MKNGARKATFNRNRREAAVLPGGGKPPARGKHRPRPGPGTGRQGGPGSRSQTDSDTKLLYCWMFRLRMSEHGPRTRSNRGRSSFTHFKGPRATTVAARGRFIRSAISPVKEGQGSGEARVPPEAPEDSVYWSSEVSTGPPTSAPEPNGQETIGDLTPDQVKVKISPSGEPKRLRCEKKIRKTDKIKRVCYPTEREPVLRTSTKATYQNSQKAPIFPLPQTPRFLTDAVAQQLNPVIKPPNGKTNTLKSRVAFYICILVNLKKKKRLQRRFPNPPVHMRDDWRESWAELRSLSTNSPAGSPSPQRSHRAKTQVSKLQPGGQTQARCFYKQNVTGTTFTFTYTPFPATFALYSSTTSRSPRAASLQQKPQGS